MSDKGRIHAAVKSLTTKYTHRCDGCGTYRAMGERGRLYPCECSTSARIRPIFRQPISADDSPKMMGYPKVELDA